MSTTIQPAPVVMDETRAEAKVPPAGDSGPELDPVDLGSGPKRLGRYVLLAKLGHGGMGVVYVAYDERLDRKVAIKLLRQRAGAKTQQRLLREAKAMAKLSHPNVVQIYEFAEVGGQLFVVMEFVEGLTLRRWMAAAPRTRTQVLAVFVAAGRGLAAAHAKGLIHRDFKPDNVMIASDGRVQVMDFGLARSEDPLGAGLRKTEPEAKPDPTRGTNPGTNPDLSSHLTAAGAVIGTPAYMAPEQLEGRTLDARSDQFSFCVTLWEALFDKRPFHAESISELSEVVSAGKFDQPERSGVPSWLRKVLRRGLEPDPAKRWPSMNQLLDAIEQDPTRRRRLVIAGLAACLSLAGLVGALSTREAEIPWQHDQVRADLSTCELAGREIEDDWNEGVQAQLRQAFASTDLSFADTAWSRTQAWMDDYALHWRALRTEACFVQRSAERGGVVRPAQDPVTRGGIAACLDQRRASFKALLDAWADADATTVTLALSAAASLPPVAHCRDPIWQSQRLDPPAQLADEVDRLRTRLRRAAALRLAGKLGPGLTLAQETLSAAKQLGWRPLEAEAELALGRLQDELGDYQAASASLERAYLAAIAGVDDLVALEASAWLTLVVGDKLGQLEEGLRWGQLGLMYLQRLGLEGSIYEAELLYGIGLIQDRNKHAADARRSLQQALDIAAAELGPQHPEVARQLNGLGGVYWALGDYPQALETQVRAHAIVEAALGPDHPEVARCLTNQGLVLSRLGRSQEALEVQRRALIIREQALGPQHPDVAATRNAIAATHTQAGAPRQALAEHQRALALLEAELGPEHPRVAATLANIAESQRALGRREAALESAERSLALLERSLDAEHPEVRGARERVAALRSK